MGYGAMQLAGPHVFGPARDLEEARAVLREAAGEAEEARRRRMRRPAEPLDGRAAAA